MHCSVSDPLCQFAVVFAALMHDADHEGKSNRHGIDYLGSVSDMYLSMVLTLDVQSTRRCPKRPVDERKT